MDISVGTHGTVTLPPILLRNLRAVHGDRLDAWLPTLPALLVGLLDDLDATIVPGEPQLSYNLVFFAKRREGDEIVIKATVPNDEQPPEVAGVGVLSDSGVGPRLLWADLARGAMAMERVLPGTTLPTHIPTVAEDAEIVAGIGRIAARIARDANIGPRRDRLVTVSEYTRTLDTRDPASGLWREHRDEIERALALRDAMLADQDRAHGFVHGDLHHYNILVGEGGEPRVIDPKGLVGPIGYDFGVMGYNPIGIQRHPDLAALFRQRATVWSDATGLPWEEVRNWGYVGAMVSACWDSEDGSEGWRDTFLSAMTMRQLTAPR